MADNTHPALLWHCNQRHSSRWAPNQINAPPLTPQQAHTRLYGMIGLKRMMSTSFQPSCSMALSMMAHFFHRCFRVVSTQPWNR